MNPFSAPRWVWIVYVVLFAASVPWYLPDGPVPLWFGLPYWVVLSVGSIAGVAVFTLVVVRRYWSEEDPVTADDDGDPELSR